MSIQTVGDAYRVNRNWLRAGDLVRIEGQRGRFEFRRLEANPDTGRQWGVFFGGRGGHEMLRYFDMGRVIRTRRKVQR